MGLLSCLSVTLVYCGQTAGRIKIKPGTQVGLEPGHIALDGNPAHPPKKGSQPPIFGPCPLWPNSWMDQDATWCRGRPWPRQLLDGFLAPLTKKREHSPQFSANVYCGQMARWIKMLLDRELGLGLSDTVLDGDRAPPNRGSATPANFWPMRIVAKWLNASVYHLVRR